MRSRGLVYGGVAALLLLCSAASVWAQPMPLDKRTYFTFSGPVTLPNVTLPAGKYVFHLIDNSQWVMQVLSADGKTTYGLMLVNRVQRPDIPNDPEVQFLETPAGMPHAVQTWWYRGQSTGWELVYPKDQARRLAKGAKQPVLTTTRSEPLINVPATEPEYARISPAGDEMRITVESSPAAVAPVGPRELGEVAPPSLALAAPQMARATLPKTASQLPLLGLVGVMLLFAAGVSYAVRA